jgi:signal peptidase II
MRRLPYLGIMAALVAFDQLTKWLIVRSLELHDYRPLVEGCLSLSHVRNYGAAFGIMADADLPHQAVFFSALSLAALVAIAVYAFRLPAEARLPQLALSLILGGAVGNLIDRLRLGYVVDFVHVYWKHHQWPDFNAADSAITVGVSLLILDILRSPQTESAQTPDKLEAVSPAGRTE